VVYLLGQSRRTSSALGWAIPLALLTLGVVGGVVSWLVTRWRISGGDLQIEMGLIRRQSLRIPLVRIQAVDVVSPLFARFLGLAEVRVVSAGTGTERSRLAYLPVARAQEVRSQLLALAHGLAPTALAPEAYPLYKMDNGKFVVGTLLRAPLLLHIVPAGVAFAVELLSGRAPVFAIAVIGLTIPSLVATIFAVVNVDWAFTLSEAPDGLRLDRGLLQTRHETIPFGRVQGIRVLQPVLWRPFGWYAIGVDVARQSIAKRTDARGQSLTRWLAPVATRAQVDWLVSRVCPGARVDPPPRARVPARAAWVIPFGYHFAACWSDDRYVYGRTGRVTSRTTVVSLQKVQSIRLRQGPLLRLLGLMDVYVDTAGHRWGAAGLARDATEANTVAWQWADLARNSRTA
jgi:putative membrane protein